MQVTIKVSECGGVWMANAKADDGRRLSVAAQSKDDAISRCRAKFGDGCTYEIESV